MIKKRNKGAIYIRRLRESDKADDFCTAIRLVLFKGKYGLFRRGYNGICLIAAGSKLNIKQSFNNWKEAKKFFEEK